MKQYVIDTLRPEDHRKLKAYLDANYAVAGFEDLYWLPIDGRLYTEIQKSHLDCHPLYFALELFPERLACELLVRTNNRIRCDCIHYATAEQRNWLIAVVDAFFNDLGIIT
jgi:hypothetical protein